ncbi:hypothetical protein F8388_001772 [Cannabis sativa]|uniref:O-acyltransferase WSD1 C-terminal domain-containing protein n=1 Tax=Cannabis sativa TaxID=3483 RepID=A0A7J6F2T2_CANSA|nr:hypothetical protein F8388_001772 [Cannabis sativa]
MAQPATYLISKTNTTTKHEPSKNKHDKVDSSSIKNGANYEENAGNQHGQPSSEASGCVRSTKGGNQSSQGREEYALVVNFKSYINKMTVVLSVEESVIPDPHQLCGDTVESLKLLKHSVVEKYQSKTTVME